MDEFDKDDVEDEEETEFALGWRPRGTGGGAINVVCLTFPFSVSRPKLEFEADEAVLLKLVPAAATFLSSWSSMSILSSSESSARETPMRELGRLGVGTLRRSRARERLLSAPPLPPALAPVSEAIEVVDEVKGG